MRRGLDSPRMPIRRQIILLAAALVALFLAGCGSGEEIPSDRAEALTAQLDQLEQEIDAGDCESADATLTALSAEIQDLSGEIDRDIRRGLRDLFGQLDSLFVEQCGEPTTTTETTTTEPTTETTTPTTTTEETTTDTTTTTTTDTTTTTTNDTTAPDGGGGSGGSGPGGGSE